MNRIDITNWREFKVSELFDIHPTKHIPTVRVVYTMLMVRHYLIVNYLTLMEKTQ